MKNKVKKVIGGIIGIIVAVIFTQLSKKAYSEFTEEEIDINKPWFRNTLFGFSFETPERLRKESVEKPLGYEEYINSLDGLFLEYDGLITMFLYMDTNFKDYDTEGGIQGSIQNSISALGGADLNLDFSKPEGELEDLIADGTFNCRGEEMLARGYIYWNGNGKVMIFTTFIPNQESNMAIIDKIFNSRRVAF